MPFVIQCVGEVFDRLDGLEAATKKEEQAPEDLDTVRPTPFQPFRSVCVSIELLTSWVVGQMDTPLALPAHAQQGAGEGDMQGFTGSRPVRAGRHKVNGEGPSLALGVIGGSIV